MALDPGYAEAQCNLGCFLGARRGRHDEAEAALRAAVAADPAHARALFGLGRLLEAVRGDEAAAEEMYRRAVDADPMYLEARFNLCHLDEPAGGAGGGSGGGGSGGASPAGPQDIALPLGGRPEVSLRGHEFFLLVLCFEDVKDVLASPDLLAGGWSEDWDGSRASSRSSCASAVSSGYSRLDASGRAASVGGGGVGGGGSPRSLSPSTSPRSPPGSLRRSRGSHGGGSRGSHRRLSLPDGSAYAAAADRSSWRYAPVSNLEYPLEKLEACNALRLPGGHVRHLVAHVRACRAQVLRLVVQARGAHPRLATSPAAADLRSVEFYPKNLGWGEGGRRPGLSDVQEEGGAEDGAEASFVAALRGVLQSLFA